MGKLLLIALFLFNFAVSAGAAELTAGPIPVGLTGTWRALDGTPGIIQFSGTNKVWIQPAVSGATPLKGTYIVSGQFIEITPSIKTEAPATSWFMERGNLLVLRYASGESQRFTRQ